MPTLTLHTRQRSKRLSCGNNSPHLLSLSALSQFAKLNTNKFPHSAGSSEFVVPPTGPEPTVKKGPSVAYGPYEDVKPFSDSPVTIHYKDNKPILVAKTLSREIELSHWGSNLGVTEYYDLFHRGAALRDKLFSRIDFQFAQYSRGLRSNVLEEFRITLPPKAANVYYRDDIGNVSTSNFRKSMIRDSIMDVKPRYPLYGGWKYNWHHTYDVPLNDYLKVDSKSGRYILNVKFMGSLSNVTIEDARLRVVLPEGATNVKVALPFPADSEEHSRFYTNLDTIGRPNVVIGKKNAADEYAVDVQISYEYPPFELLRKPLVVSATFFGLLLAGLIYARLDFSLVPHDPSTDAATIMPKQREETTKVIALAKSAFLALDAAFEAYRSGKKTREELTAAREEQKGKVERSILRLAKVRNAVSVLKQEAAFVKGVQEIEKGFKERLDKMVVYQDAVVAFLVEMQASGKVDEKKKDALQVKVVKYELDKKDIDANLDRLFEELEV
ncbi:hypothetical protein HDU99_002567 [Rhizoclosmatium hyalinum]|nr:hypothetical protein HDU99_002567 [Rhizoclosmatium hyalinum]